ncbi:MAG: hypothetical protein ACXVLQ_18605, partial [Bacteriovorax sp.]
QQLALKQIGQELEESSFWTRAQTVKAAEESIQRNETLRNEFSRMGITFNDNKAQASVEAANAPQNKVAEPSVISAKGDYMANQKMLYPDANANANANSRVSKMFDQVASDSIKAFAPIDDQKRGRESNDTENKLRSRIAELESKEKNLSKKSGQSNGESEKNGTDELQNLKKQIEELKGAQAKSLAEKKMGSDKEGKVASSSSSAPSNSTSVGGYGARSFSRDNEWNDRRDQAQAYAQNSAPRNGHAEYQETPSINAVSRAPASGGSSGNSLSKALAEKAAGGIMLTKSGEVMIDPATILDNPKEGDIVSLIEQTHGQAFLIRENGTLMKVMVELDAAGKPQLSSNGRPIFKKVKLSKAQQEIIAKETNVPKLLKEVGPEPTRLFRLKSLIHETVQRE